MKSIVFIALCLALACAPQALPNPALFGPADVGAGADASDSAAVLDSPTTDAQTTEASADSLPVDAAVDGAQVADAEVASSDVADADGSAQVTDADATQQKDADATGLPDTAGGDTAGDGSGDGDALASTDGETSDSQTSDGGEVVPFMPFDATPCAQPQALPTDCTQCSAGFVAVASNAGSVCAPDFPMWGPRPDSPLASWFVDKGNATVTDSHSGRTWVKASSPIAVQWAAANGYCAGLDVAGYTDWRLPSLAELQTLRDIAAAPPTAVTALAATPKEFFWTASPVSAAAKPAYWTLFFNGGFTAFSEATASHYVRCVR